MIFSAMAALLLSGGLGDPPPSAPHDEIRIDKGARPNKVVRTYEGNCGSARFAVEIAPGPLSGAPIRGLRVGPNSFSKAVVQANAALRDVPGSAIEAVIDRCDHGRARVRIDISNPADRKLLQIRSFWLASDGSISKLKN